MNAGRRYQVYISTTYSDMLQARHAITLPLLKMGMVPVGIDSDGAMANQLPAVTQKLIDESDYYMVLLGGRYGDLSPLGLSDLHREFIYAMSKRKPMLAFVHDRLESLAESAKETTREGQVRRSDFARLVEQKIPTHTWSSEQGLANSVTAIMPELLRQYPVSGWVRADMQVAAVPSTPINTDVLTQQIRDLTAEREELLATLRPPLTTLSRGSDTVAVQFSCSVYQNGDCKTAMADTTISWNQVFSCIAPLMLNPVAEPLMQKALEEFISRRALDNVKAQHPKAHAVRNVALASHSFNQIKVQLRALGLITRTSEKDARGMPLWRLTAHGDSTMTNVMAVRKSPA